MIKILTAINNPELNEELKNENNIKVEMKDIQYKEGILEALEKNMNIDYIIIDKNLPGEIEFEDLLQKILEKNKIIKIIITIKKENKINNEININNKNIIKIFYENKIDLNKIKKYKEYLYEIKNEKNNNIKNNNNNSKKINIKKDINKINNKKILDKLKNNINIKNTNKKIETKIITILGERKVGKSITIINFTYYLQNKGYKILIIELNEESSSLYTIFGCKKYNKKQINKKIKLKNKIDKKMIKYIIKYIDKKIMEDMIVKINKNIHLISYSKLIKYESLKKIRNNYNYIIIEIFSKKNKKIIKKILNNSNKNVLLIKPNLIEIKNTIKIMEKNEINKLINLKIIINNYNEYSINDKIINKIFIKNKIIGKINYKKEYELIINKNLKIGKLYTKIISNNLKKFDKILFL